MHCNYNALSFPGTPGSCMSGTASGAQMTGTETGSRNQGFQFQNWSIETKKQMFIKCKNNMLIKTHTHMEKYLTHVQQ